MRPLGPETQADQDLREWFAEQERQNLNRLEDGAKIIIQLVTGLYGVLFAILALSSQSRPRYLDQCSVRIISSLSVLAFFFALIAALATLYPKHIVFQEDNLSNLNQVRRGIAQRKALGVRLSLWCFLIGIGLLGVLIIVILWRIY